MFALLAGSTKKIKRKKRSSKTSSEKKSKKVKWVYNRKTKRWIKIVGGRIVKNCKKKGC